MHLEGEGTLLRVFIGEADRVDHGPLYAALVRAAREAGLAGATVLRGAEGFGANSRTIHTARLLRLSEDLPMVVEVVDADDRIEAFLPTVDELLERTGGGAMVTLEKVTVRRYHPGKGGGTLA